jgi:hypothetical protein
MYRLQSRLNPCRGPKWLQLQPNPKAHELAQSTPGDRDSLVQTLVDSAVSMTVAIKWHLHDG